MSKLLYSWITNLADTAVVLPLSLILIGVLWREESGRAAWLFGRALLLCLTAMATLKIVLLSCGQALGTQIASPSGHASLAVFFYGSLGTLAWARRPGGPGLCMMLAVVWLAVSIAMSRVVLGAHSATEVVIGFTVGSICLALFAWPYLRLAHPDLRLRRIALWLLPVFLLFYGSISPAEIMLRKLVPYFQAAVCKQA